MRRREVVDDGVAREPFDRSPATWRRLGAPADLVDVAAAAEAWNSYAPWGWRLDGFPEHPARQILAARHWRWARPAFLAEVGALTAREQELLERFPKAYGRPACRVQRPPEAADLLAAHAQQWSRASASHHEGEPSSLR